MNKNLHSWEKQGTGEVRTTRARVEQADIRKRDGVCIWCHMVQMYVQVTAASMANNPPIKGNSSKAGLVTLPVVTGTRDLPFAAQKRNPLNEGTAEDERLSS